MNFNFKNLSKNTKRIRIIPKNGTELFANIGVDNPTAMIDEDGVFSVCLSPITISCDGAEVYVDFAILLRDGVDPSIVDTDLLLILDGETILPYTPRPVWLAPLEPIPFPYDVPNAFSVLYTTGYSNVGDQSRRVEMKSLSDDIQVIAYSNTTSVQLSSDNSHAGACLSKGGDDGEISCDDSPSSIILPLTGGAYYEIVDGETIYGGLIRHLIVGAYNQNYFEGLRFEVVTGTNIDPTTVRIVNLADNAKRIKFTVIDASPISENIFGYRNLNYAETVLAHNVVSVDDGYIFEFCLGAGDGNEIPYNEIHFTTTAGSVNYVGNQGDQILLSNGTIIDITSTDETVTFDVPSGRHIVKLIDSIDRSNFVSISGEALIELHNFPTLSSVDDFSTELCTNLVKVPTVLPSNITALRWMFSGATSFNQDISMWDVSNVLRMDGMFQDATSFNQDISMWDVSNVLRMDGMFSGATSFNQPLSSWNVANIYSMGEMFYNATSFNQDISMWNVSDVTNMTRMFFGASAFNQDLSNWCVSNITTLPNGFDQEATNWTLPRPVWGTCP